MMLDWIGKVAELLKVIVQKIFTTGPEKAENRVEKEKEAWDAFQKKAEKIAHDRRDLN